MADKSVPRKKTASKKPARNSAQSDVNRSYEHHLEKWLENTSKMNFDYSHHDGNWPFMNAPNAFPQQTSRKGSSHLQQTGYSSNDPISLPSHIVSFTTRREPTFFAKRRVTAFSLPQNSSPFDGSPSISAFMNFNSSFKQQYPHLLQRQQSHSPISNDLASLSTQQDFLSLPIASMLKNDKIPSTDQEKLNDAVISQTRR